MVRRGKRHELDQGLSQRGSPSGCLSPLVAASLARVRPCRASAARRRATAGGRGGRAAGIRSAHGRLRVPVRLFPRRLRPRQRLRHTVRAVGRGGCRPRRTAGSARLRYGWPGPHGTLLHLWHQERKGTRSNAGLLEETRASDRVEAVQGLHQMDKADRVTLRGRERPLGAPRQTVARSVSDAREAG